MLFELPRTVDGEPFLLGPVVAEEERLVGDADADVAPPDHAVEITGPGRDHRRGQCVLRRLFGREIGRGLGRLRGR